MPLNYHTSIKTLPVWNFYEVLFTGDFTHLYLDPPEKPEDLSEVWATIEEEQFKSGKLDNKHLKQHGKVLDLKRKYSRIAILLEMVSDKFNSTKDAEKKALASYGYIFDPNKTFDEEIERMHRNLNVLETKIKLEESKLPPEETEKPDIMQEALNLESILYPNGNRTIDIYTTPMERWNALKRMAEQRLKAKRHE